MTVAYGGHPGETVQLRDLAERHGLWRCSRTQRTPSAPGSTARHLGTFGAVGAFSFFSNKNLAVGEGGMVVTDDDEIAARLRLLRSHGMTTLTWDRHRGHASSYDVVALGYNYRLDEPRAALALSRLARLESENEQRRAHVARYRAAFEGAERFVVALPPAADTVSAEHLFTIVLDEDVDRDAFRADARRAGHPDERALSARAHVLDLRRQRSRAAGDVELRRTDGDAAALRPHDRQAGRARHRRSAGLHELPPSRLRPDQGCNVRGRIVEHWNTIEDVSHEPPTHRRQADTFAERRF